MAPMRPFIGIRPTVCRMYSRVAMAAARPRSSYMPGAIVIRPFSACALRRMPEEDPVSKTINEALASSSSPPPPPPPPSQTQSSELSSSRIENQQSKLSPQNGDVGPFREFPNFFPRTEYQPPLGTTKSYFIGHHRTALVQMRVKLASVGLVIECRDLRVPLSSSNPLLEATLMNSRPGGSRTAQKYKREKAEKAENAKREAEEAEGEDGSEGAEEPVVERKKTLEDFERDDGTTLPGLSGHLPPVAKQNPLLSVGDTDNRRMRIIVYTKRDLMQREGAKYAPTEADFKRLAALDAGNADAVVFLGNHAADKKTPNWKKKSSGELRTLMQALRQAARAHGERSLTPLYALVVGMPNSGKSTLLNRLRAEGMTDANARSNVSRTGSEAGVTRKIGTPVRILEDTSKVIKRAGAHEKEDEWTGSSNGENAGLLVFDTPGVFMPYVPEAETMVKLALVSTVRENMVMPTALADYLLYQLNKRDPKLYMEPYKMSEPTNDANVLLDAVARRTGKLGRGGVPDHKAAAQQMVSAFRAGKLGNFCLDDLSAEAVDEAAAMSQNGPPLSLNQAKKREKELKKHLQAERRGKARGAALTEF